MQLQKAKKSNLEKDKLNHYRIDGWIAFCLADLKAYLQALQDQRCRAPQKPQNPQNLGPRIFRGAMNQNWEGLANRKKQSCAHSCCNVFLVATCCNVFAAVVFVALFRNMLRCFCCLQGHAKVVLQDSLQICPLILDLGAVYHCECLHQVPPKLMFSSIAYSNGF